MKNRKNCLGLKLSYIFELAAIHTNNLKYKRLYLIFILIATACNFSNKKRLSVEILNDSAVSITKHYSDTTKFNEAISLLNQALLIDSSNFETYKKKYFFESSLGDFKAAANTLNKLITFKPDSADLYSQAGFLQELKNDTIEAKRSFNNAIILYKKTLDTMDKKNPLWFFNWKMSAICTIMVGQEKIISDFLKENCTTAMDSSIYDVNTLSKSKEELLETFKQKYSR